MVIPNKPWEAPYVLTERSSVQEATALAWQMAQRRNKENPTSPERYKVNGFTY